MTTPNPAIRAVPPPEGRPAPPDDVSEPMQAWWRDVVEAFNLDPHHLLILEQACRAWDRCVEAGAVLDRDGLTVTDRYDQIKSHPCVSTENTARTTFARLVRELDLDAAAAPAIPTRRGGGYR